MEIVNVNINDIGIHPECPNVRSEISDNDIEELKNSIAEQGLQQPINVFKLPNAEGIDKVYLVSGERRLRAFKLLADKDKKFNEIPCVFKEYKGNTERVIQSVLMDNMIENLQRDNVNVLDLANRLKWLRDIKKMDAWQVSKSVGKSKAWFDQTIKLLDMSDEAKAKLRSGEIGLSEARNISRLPKEVQGETAGALAKAKKEGNKKGAKKLKEAIVEAGKVRSTTMVTSRKQIDRNRNILILIMTAMKADQKKGNWGEKEPQIYNILQGALDALNWILGHNKEWGLHKLMQKYGIVVDEEGNKTDPKKEEKTEKKDKKEKKEKSEKSEKSEKKDKDKAEK